MDRQKFPPTMATGADTEVKNLALTIDALEKSQNQAKATATAVLRSYPQFFGTHFGTDPYKGIYNMYIAPAIKAGSPVKQGGGTNGTLAIAQEIAAFNPPAKQYNLTVEQIAAILNSMVIQLSRDQQIAEKRAMMRPLLKDAVYGLEARPSAEAVKNYGKLSMSDLKVKDSDSLLYGYKLYPSNTQGAAQGLFKPTAGNYHILNMRDIMLHKEVDGYHIFPMSILAYYHMAFSRDPNHFWSVTGRHRLAVEPSNAYGPGYFIISVFEVNPVTGAPTGRSLPVAKAPQSSYQDNSGYFLSTFKQKYFPEMNLTTDGVVDSSVDETALYAKAKDMWTGIPSKSATHIVPILEQSFVHHKDENTLRRPDKNKTSIPVIKLKLMMQPEGVETAMKRILDLKDGHNAIKKWVLKDLTGGQAKDNEDRSFTLVGVVKGEEKLKNDYEVTMKILYRILSHPKLYTSGVGFLDSYTNTSNFRNINLPYLLGNDLASRFAGGDVRPYLAHVSSIMRLAGWPQGTPQVIFETPIDDQADAVNSTRRFYSYMRENFAQPAGPLHLPESFNGRLVTSKKIHVLEAGGQALPFKIPDKIDIGLETGRVEIDSKKYDVNFRFDAGVQYHFSMKGTDTMATSYRMEGNTVQVFNSEIFVLDTKTVVSGKSLTGNGGIKLPAQIVPQMQAPAGVKLNDAQTGAGIAVAGMIAAAGIFFLG